MAVPDKKYTIVLLISPCKLISGGSDASITIVYFFKCTGTDVFQHADQRSGTRAFQRVVLIFIVVGSLHPWRSETGILFDIKTGVPVKGKLLQIDVIY